MSAQERHTATKPFNPLDYPIALASPLRLTDIPSWRMHIPFAFALVAMLRPRTFAELGVFRGDSLAAICQAVSTLQLSTTCVGVDTWQGDIHIGAYDDAIYLDIAAYVSEHYGSFASLMRCTFDEAVGQIEDGSIDLLHIDGTHTYEAVRHDFDTWVGKLSPRGVIIMHDVCERQADFGVYRVWAEIQQAYSTCTFPYGHGLGVVAVGQEVPEAFRSFMDAMNCDPTVVQYFQVLGERVRRMAEDAEQVNHLKQQLAESQANNQRVAELTAETSRLNAELYSVRTSGAYQVARMLGRPLRLLRGHK